MKAMLLLLGGLVLTVFVAALGTVFMWASWNWGVVPALSCAKPIGLFGAFCLALFLSNFGAMFKSSLTINTKE